MHESIITSNMSISAFSGRPAECVHHCVFGSGVRALADEDGLTIPLTNDEHNMSSKGTIFQIHGNPAAERLSKMVGQLAWERDHILEELCESKSGIPPHDWKKQHSDEVRQEFRKRYGKSYL